MARRIGEVVHYYPRAHAAAVRLDDGELHAGDTIRIVGHGHDLTEPVASLELDHRRIKTGFAGETIGVAVGVPVREHDAVYVVEGSQDMPED
jgi:translation elongation factor EF-Tu-like GTPase